MQASVIKKTLLWTVASLCLSSAASAQEIAIKGATPCGKWVNESKENDWPRLINRSWFMGFISGKAAESRRDVLRGTDAASLYLWLDNYCQSNPLKDIADAADMLVLELAKQKRL